MFRRGKQSLDWESIELVEVAHDVANVPPLLVDSFLSPRPSLIDEYCDMEEVKCVLLKIKVDGKTHTILVHSRERGLLYNVRH